MNGLNYSNKTTPNFMSNILLQITCFLFLFGIPLCLYKFVWKPIYNFQNECDVLIKKMEKINSNKDIRECREDLDRLSEKAFHISLKHRIRSLRNKLHTIVDWSNYKD